MYNMGKPRRNYFWVSEYKPLLAISQEVLWTFHESRFLKNLHAYNTDSNVELFITVIYIYICINSTVYLTFINIRLHDAHILRFIIHIGNIFANMPFSQNMVYQSGNSFNMFIFRCTLFWFLTIPKFLKKFCITLPYNKLSELTFI